MAHADLARTGPMCGRFSLFTVAEVIAKLFGLGEVPDVEPRYNIAPTQDVGVVRLEAPRGDMDGPGPAARRFQTMRWGFVPHWAKDPGDVPLMINARSEEVFDKPAFRTAATRSRCLVPADGFYEWKKMKGGKQPMFIHREDGRPFAFAGLWSSWQGDDAAAGGAGHIVSCTILTCAPNATVAPVHDRMPVILPEDAYGDWLDPDTSQKDLERLLVPYEAATLEAYPVSKTVNRPGPEGEQLIKRQGQEALF